MKLIAALDAAGIALIGEGAVSEGGGRGVRLKAASTDAQSDRDKGAAIPARPEG
jgi:hypothetical protein